MLVIPALLSLKSDVMEEPAQIIVQLVESVSLKLDDPSEIVAKTSVKLLKELKRVHAE